MLFNHKEHGGGHSARREVQAIGLQGFVAFVKKMRGPFVFSKLTWMTG